MTWGEILICVIVVLLLVKILKNNYNEKYGRKR